MNQIKFSSTSLSEELKQGIADMGFEEATSIQSQSIPLILEGHDLIGRSQTGSGKTAAFGLPAIDMIDENIGRKKVQVLILCPTRELAVQGANEIKKFAKYKKGINVVAIYGGESIELQSRNLRQGCQIVVGTPGRIMDHMRRKTLKLNNVQMVVLDEADEMLNMGFVEDIEIILAQTPQERQTILFSATMPSAVLAITKKFQNNPKMVEIKQQHMTVSTVEQYYFKTPKGQKTAALCRLLEYHKPNSSIIFCNTKKMVDELILDLKKHGYHAQGLHGDMRQSARSQVMNQFKKGMFDILVATDVAARGIDVDDVKIVFNYDLPRDYEYYVHRIGRTGRAGKLGQTFALVQSASDLTQLRNIMRYTKCDIQQKPLPTLTALKELELDKLSNEISAFMGENDFSQYYNTVESLITEKHNEKDVAAALIAMSIKKNVVAEDLSDNFEDFETKNNKLGRSQRSFKKGTQRADGTGRSGRTTFKRHEYNDENMVSVRISVGKRDKVSPSHILGAVAGETGLPGKIFGAISIKDSYSTVDVPKEYRKLVVQKLHRSKIKGRTVTVV